MRIITRYISATPHKKPDAATIINTVMSIGFPPFDKPDGTVNDEIGRILGENRLPLADSVDDPYIPTNSRASASTPEAHRNSNGPRARFFVSACQTRTESINV